MTVPNKALRFTPNKDIVGGRKINDCQSSHKVWTLDNNTFTAHPVKIGITDGSKTEIVSGITENTPVVTETVVKGAMPGMEEPSAGEGERSPFMPGDTEPLDFAGSQVLLVEDNELNREIALELLGGFGMIIWVKNAQPRRRPKRQNNGSRMCTVPASSQTPA